MRAIFFFFFFFFFAPAVIFLAPRLNTTLQLHVVVFKRDIKKMFWSKRNVEEADPIELNPVLEKIGHFTKFHVIQITLLWITILSSGTGILAFAFTGYQPKYRCIVPQCEDVATATYYKNPINYTDEWSEDNLVFTDFVDMAVNSLPSHHDCERVTFDGAKDDSCEDFTEKLKTNSTKQIVHLQLNEKS